MDNIDIIRQTPTWEAKCRNCDFYCMKENQIYYFGSVEHALQVLNRKGWKNGICPDCQNETKGDSHGKTDTRKN
jgi:hypothetical protein